MDLRGKNIVVGVTGGIACYKACELVSALAKSGANVDVIMTKNAERFVSRLTFETLTGNRAVCDMFDRDFVYEVEHVSLAQKAHLFVIAPATANIIAKINRGIADDMLSTTVMATRSPIIICPAMNDGMYSNVNFQENLCGLRKKGYIIVDAVEGRLACDTVGKGRLANIPDILKEIERQLFKKNDYASKTVMVTAGPTVEEIDGVRFISNHSSGKMGCEIARAAKERGANVILIAGKITAPAPAVERIDVLTTRQMRDAVMENLQRADIIIKAAAPSDYRVVNRSKNKIKTDSLTLVLEKNPDIALEVGELKGDKKLVIFCAETENLIENALEKIRNKHADMIVANDVTKEGAGFETDTNIVTIIDSKGSIEDLPKMSKCEVANIILDKLLQL
ncbi:MAG: bifunctional phosphopantothenoylcysteine decarboxylase/phosphopantothenate--cysteine ligase CoaBC [Clostridiales bacterium]|jgi:phosphopantothenoylcysteine decarboxylase/phosphopantothenate--cysteine ligase|nr:bifunctional phosphopantothenoylcysteine decarboxylase/phosphopantothenate--cysteine ligase CoaBC [Clostridiales bacterium]